MTGSASLSASSGRSRRLTTPRGGGWSGRTRTRNRAPLHAGPADRAAAPDHGTLSHGPIDERCAGHHSPCRRQMFALTTHATREWSGDNSRLAPRWDMLSESEESGLGPAMASLLATDLTLWAPPRKTPRGVGETCRAGSECAAIRTESGMQTRTKMALAIAVPALLTMSAARSRRTARRKKMGILAKLALAAAVPALLVMPKVVALAQSRRRPH